MVAQDMAWSNPQGEQIRYTVDIMAGTIQSSEWELYVRIHVGEYFVANVRMQVSWMPRPRSILCQVDDVKDKTFSLKWTEDNVRLEQKCFCDVIRFILCESKHAETIIESVNNIIKSLNFISKMQPPPEEATLAGSSGWGDVLQSVFE